MMVFYDLFGLVVENIATIKRTGVRSLHCVCTNIYAGMSENVYLIFGLYILFNNINYMLNISKTEGHLLKLY